MQALMVACPAQYWIGSENYSGKENRRSLIAGRRFESGLFRNNNRYGPVAPIGRALDLHSSCCGFESHPVHNKANFIWGNIRSVVRLRIRIETIWTITTKVSFYLWGCSGFDSDICGP